MSGLALVGQRIREARQRQRLTVEELARRCGISKSTLSKIENARLIPNLPTLAEIARTIGVGLDELVRGTEGPPPQPWKVLRAKDRSVTERDEATGMRYEALASLTHGAGVFEVYQLSVDPGAKRRLVSTDGRQIVIMLKGRLDFIIGDDTVTVTAGDVLEFNGRLAHVPKNPYAQGAQLLALYLLPEKETP